MILRGSQGQQNLVAIIFPNNAIDHRPMPISKVGHEGNNGKNGYSIHGLIGGGGGRITLANG